MKYQPHYGWVIAGVLFTCFTLTVGMLQYSYGVFVAPLEEEFGWTRAEINVSLSFFAMTGLLAPVAGPILDRFGSSRVMMFSYLILAISFLPRPWMTELWEFYVLNILMYAGMPGAIMLPVGKLIGIWFTEARGRAVGITAMGANFGGFIFSAQTRTLIDLTDWRETYFIFGVAIALLIPLIALTIRDTPKRTADIQQGPDPQVSAVLEEGMAARDAIRTRAFLLITAGLLLATIPYQSVLTQIIPHLEAEGMSSTNAAWVLSVLAVFGMVGKVLLGWLSDIIAARKVFVGSLFLQAFGLVVLINGGTSIYVWLVFVPIFGIAFGGMGSLMTLLPLETFGIRAFASIFGLLSLLILPTALIGPPLTGYAFDVTGSYTIAFYVIAALLVIGSVALWFAAPPKWQTDSESKERQQIAQAAT
ncbi:MAG: MFS transporter [Dehalococcoidia bacterium]|nr:MFS transporter [Dehalococcoidia bacterium]